MRERRTIQQMYYDIITVIMDQNQGGEPLKITRIQLASKISFDKLKDHIQTMIM